MSHLENYIPGLIRDFDGGRPSADRSIAKVYEILDKSRDINKQHEFLEKFQEALKVYMIDHREKKCSGNPKCQYERESKELDDRLEEMIDEMVGGKESVYIPPFQQNFYTADKIVQNNGTVSGDIITDVEHFKKIKPELVATPIPTTAVAAAPPVAPSVKEKSIVETVNIGLAITKHYQQSLQHHL